MMRGKTMEILWETGRNTRGSEARFGASCGRFKERIKGN
jgi:hypothetical protein